MGFTFAARARFLSVLIFLLTPKDAPTGWGLIMKLRRSVEHAVRTSITGEAPLCTCGVWGCERAIWGAPAPSRDRSLHRALSVLIWVALLLASTLVLVAALWVGTSGPVPAPLVVTPATYPAPAR